VDREKGADEGDTGRGGNGLLPPPRTAYGRFETQKYGGFWIYCFVLAGST